MAFETLKKHLEENGFTVSVFATAQDNSKPLLKCVNLKFTDVGLRAAGSNGNCIVTAKGDDQSKGDISLLIPAASLGKLGRMCADKDEFRVGTTGKNIVFFKFLHSLGNRFASVSDFPTQLASRQYFLTNGFGIFKTRIIVGNNNFIRQSLSDFSH